MPAVNHPISAPAVTHYENFPVASWLCPAHLRSAIRAIYAFARTADDIADEGDDNAEQRLEKLQAFDAQLQVAAQPSQAITAWPAVFQPLQAEIQRHHLPVNLLRDLLSAFSQDVRVTAAGGHYRDRAELLDYCRRSANPIGRLLLHLYGVKNELALARSDQICSALQLINFWQDLSVDLPRGRYYPTQDDCQRHGVNLETLGQSAHSDQDQRARALVADCTQWANDLMLSGSALVHQIPGRAGWELRLVVQGGLRILEKIAQMNFDTARARPRLTGVDIPLLLWRAFWM